MSGLRTVREVMSREPATLREDDALTIADDVMNLARIRHLPVVDGDGKPVGVVSQRDLFRGAISTFLGYGEHAKQGVLRQIKVSEVMAHPPQTIDADADLTLAASRLARHKIGCLLVMEDDELVGILTEGDFVRLHLPAGS